MSAPNTTAQQHTAADGARVLFGVGGLIAFVLGLFVLFSPKTSAGVVLTFVAALIGVYALVTGLVYLGVTIFSKGLGGWSRVGHGLLGVLYVVGGVIMFSNLVVSGAVVALFFSITIGFLWFLEGVLAFTMLKTAASKPLTVIYGIVSILAGLMLVFSPLMGAVTLWWLLGISMVVLGAAQMVRAFKVGKDG